MIKNLKVKFKKYLEILRALPDSRKKIILWTLVVILGLVMSYFWIINALNVLQNIGQSISNIKVPGIEKPTLENKNIETKADEKIQWKKYKNIQYNFEIEYPLDWSLRENNLGAVFFPENKSNENIIGNGSINIGFYKRGSAYCKIPFDDYVKIAGPSEIQNYNSINKINFGINNNGTKGYEITWNYTDFQGLGKISLPIVYFETKEDLCGSIQIFLNDNNYLDVYNKIVSSFNFIESDNLIE